MYSFVLDVFSFIKELNGNFPSYYERHLYGINWINILSSLTSFIIFVFGIIVSIIVQYWGKCNYLRAAIFIFGSTALSVSLHFPNILMAWATDPFYASRIALIYGATFISYFTAFHYAYILSSKVAEMSYGCFVELTHFWSGVVSIVAVFMLISMIAFTFIIFVVSIPVNNSIESSADGIKNVYNGAVVLIGILIAYKIGHFFNPFSVKDALKEALKSVEKPSFYCKNDWQELTEEERMTEVMKALIRCQTSVGHQDINDGKTKVCYSVSCCFELTLLLRYV